jgi:hypothetical protein
MFISLLVLLTHTSLATSVPRLIPAIPLTNISEIGNLERTADARSPLPIIPSTPSVVANSVVPYSSDSTASTHSRSQRPTAADEGASASVPVVEAHETSTVTAPGCTTTEWSTAQMAGVTYGGTFRVGGYGGRVKFRHEVQALIHPKIQPPAAPRIWELWRRHWQQLKAWVKEKSSRTKILRLA